MQKQEQAAWVREGRCALGIELGSTRIKAVLIGPDHAPVAMGAHDWENRLEDGVWTYHLDDVWTGIQDAYADLARNTLETCGEPLARLEAVGVSAMMHGYLPFDADGQPAGSLPHLAQHHDRQGRGGADGAVFLQHSPALEHRAPVSGHFERRGAREGHRLT